MAEESPPLSPHPGDSRSSSDWELLSMSQIDTGTPPPERAQAEAPPPQPMEDSFFSSLGVEGFLQADRRGEDAFQNRGAQVEPWRQGVESGALVNPVEQSAPGIEEELDTSGVLEKSSHTPPQQKTEEEPQYADSPVSPLAGSASFQEGASYHSEGVPQLTPNERAQLEGWLGVEKSEEKVDTESESLDAEEEEAPLAHTSQLGSSMAGEAGSEEEEEKGDALPLTVLQKWFPYEAWWQKQETLRRWVKNVLSNQAVTLWSLGVTTAVLGILLLHQMWRNRDLQAQIKAGCKKIADQEIYIRRLRDMVSSRRRVPVVRFTAYSS